MPLATLIRSICLLSIIGLGAAISVGRLAPPPRPSSVRLYSGTPQAGINGLLVSQSDRSARLIDAESGQMNRLVLSPIDRIEHVSVSPWVDADSHRQAVGRWFRREGSSTTLMPQSVGLIRVDVPTGKVLSTIDAPMTPLSPPCWYPGMTARILFAAGDGQLYRYAFETSDEAYAPAQEKPVPLIWSCDRPGAGRVFLSEPHWPRDPRWKGRLIVSMSMERPEENGRLGVSQAWWLELDAKGETIVAAGQLSDNDDPNRIERYPTMVGTADHPAMSYVTRTANQAKWELRVVPVELDAQTGNPVARMGQGRTMVEDCAPAPPAVSSNGRWLTCLIHPETLQAGPFRVDLAESTEPESPTLVAQAAGSTR